MCACARKTGRKMKKKCDNESRTFVMVVVACILLVQSLLGQLICTYGKGEFQALLRGSDVRSCTGCMSLWIVLGWKLCAFRGASACNCCLFTPHCATVRVCSSSGRLSGHSASEVKKETKDTAVHCAENVHLRSRAVEHALFIAAGKCFS